MTELIVVRKPPALLVLLPYSGASLPDLGQRDRDIRQALNNNSLRLPADQRRPKTGSRGTAQVKTVRRHHQHPVAGEAQQIGGHLVDPRIGLVAAGQLIDIRLRFIGCGFAA